MGAGPKKSRKYRDWAKEIRIISEDVRDTDARKLLRTVGRDYEKLADSAKVKAKGRK